MTADAKPPSPRARHYAAQVIPERAEWADNDRFRHRDWMWAWCEYVRARASAS